jgi:gamma-glutamylaminecyclotransferase
MSHPPNGTTRVFVYGTLLRGEPNHRLLTSALFVGGAHTEPAFDLVSLGPFPTMVEGGETSIAGEVYEVDPATLGALDRLEGAPSFYQRHAVRLEDGSEVQTYLLQECRKSKDCHPIGP